MASSARIDELRKKFDENPRRYFAPLANEYRKAGDLEQAIFICQEYLPQQPGHMSGHIVYGQALFEMGRFDEAKAVFETALSLDPENLIALRHLGDIARQAGDSSGARIWYQRVLEADPRNEEIAQIMISLLAEPETATSRPTPAAAHETPVLTEPVTPPSPMESPAPAWAMEQTDTGALDIEKSVDKTQLEGSAHGATTSPTRDEPDAGHEWLDLNDLTIGGVAIGSVHDDDAHTRVTRCHLSAMTARLGARWSSSATHSRAVTPNRSPSRSTNRNPRSNRSMDRPPSRPRRMQAASIWAAKMGRSRKTPLRSRRYLTIDTSSPRRPR